MKLDSLATQLDNEGAPFSPTDPRTGKLIPVEFRILSKNSDLVRKRVRDFQTELATNRRFGLKKGQIDFDKIDEETTITLAMCFAGWSDLDDANGEPIKFSFDAALAIVKSPRHKWLVDQIDAFAGAAENFFAEPVPSSSVGRTKSSGDAGQQTPKNATA